MRKDCYIQDKLVLIPNNADKNEVLLEILQQNKKIVNIHDKKNCPYCPGNKQHSDQLVLSFVFKISHKNGLTNINLVLDRRHTRLYFSSLEFFYVQNYLDLSFGFPFAYQLK